MHELIMFSGQGNVTVKKLKSLVESQEGKEFIDDSKMNKTFSNYLNYAITNKLSNVSYEIIATFISNEITWRKIKQKHKISNFTSYSAGIFNILSATESIPLNDILNFIIQRIKLFEYYNDNKGLYMYITRDSENTKKLKSLVNSSKEIDTAIINSDKSGVLALSNDYFDQFKSLLKRKGVKSVLKFTGLSLPYHTTFLKQFICRYEKIVDKLFENYNTNKNMNYNILFERDISIKNEINRQLINSIRWDILTKKIIHENYDNVWDTSPNNQLKKIITKSDINNKITVKGSEEIWKSQ